VQTRADREAAARNGARRKTGRGGRTHSAELATRITESLGQARAGAQTSSQEAERLPPRRPSSWRAIQDLAKGATELSALAEQLSQALRFIKEGTDTLRGSDVGPNDW